MAETFSQLQLIADVPAFQLRVKLSMLQTAIAVYGEAQGSATFTGSISGTTLTTSAVTGTISNGQTVTSATLGVVAANTTITTQLTGTSGGAGTYTVNNSQTVSSQALSSAGVTGHGTRSNFATKVLANQGYDLFTTTLAVLTASGNIANNANANTLPDFGIADTDIENQISAIWNALAGV